MNSRGLHSASIYDLLWLNTGQSWFVLQDYTTIDLETPEHPLTIIYGIDALDHAGSTVAAGDVDGDGYDDIAIGAAAFGTLRNAYQRTGGAGDGPENQRQNAGEMYVV